MENVAKETDTDPSVAGPSSENAPPKPNLFQMKAFVRPQRGEPSHPILSSPFARRIAIAASYPSKPLWYRSLDTLQFALFKELLDVVDLQRGKYVDLEEMVVILQELDPTVTREEVRGVILELDRDGSGVLDFGEFLYSLANSKHYRRLSETHPVYKKVVSRTRYTPRQRLFYSAMAYYVFTQSPADIDRFYYNKTRHKGEVLRFHMECARLQGLTEREMEMKQLEARYWGLTLKGSTESPYAKQVPFVPAFVHDRAYAYYLMLKEKAEESASYIYNLKKPVKRPLKPFKVKRELGDPVPELFGDELILHLFENSKIPMPEMKMPHRKLKQLRDKVYEDSRPYLKKVANKGMEDYQKRLREGTVLFSKKALKFQYKKDFPADGIRMRYFNMFRTYMPLHDETAHIFFPWTPPTMWVNSRPIPKIKRPPFGRAAD